MQKAEIVKLILNSNSKIPKNSSASAFSPSNIALIKYWGKRDSSINLPITDSLSISLGDKGAHTKISISDSNDQYFLNDQEMDLNSSFGLRLKHFLDLFRREGIYYRVESSLNIPMAAGLASSACGFAALVKALDQLYEWELSTSQLSILSRLGSGSACRSIWPGFVKWEKGVQTDGMDSHGIPLEIKWPELRIGLLVIDTQTKKISSTEAMQRTIESSILYKSWPKQVEQDLSLLQNALELKDFKRLGEISEHNACSMHATMLAAWPPIQYAQVETLEAMNLIWQARDNGLDLYFTQDAGPNLKLLFLEKDTEAVKKLFPNMEIVEPL